VGIQCISIASANTSKRGSTRARSVHAALSIWNLTFNFSVRSGIRHQCLPEPMSPRITSARIATIRGRGLSTWSGWSARTARHSTRVEFSSQLRRANLTWPAEFFCGGNSVILAPQLSLHQGSNCSWAFGLPLLIQYSRGRALSQHEQETLCWRQAAGPTQRGIEKKKEGKGRCG
jgi:hypothetical protein